MICIMHDISLLNPAKLASSQICRLPSTATIRILISLNAVWENPATRKKYAGLWEEVQKPNLAPRPADNQYSNNSPVSGGNGWSKWWTQRFHNCLTGLTGQVGWWFSMNWHEFRSFLLCKAPEAQPKLASANKKRRLQINTGKSN
jgi:hypothetical protein